MRCRKRQRRGGRREQGVRWMRALYYLSKQCDWSLSFRITGWIPDAVEEVSGVAGGV